MEMYFEEYRQTINPPANYNHRLAAITGKIISLVNPNKLLLVNTISASFHYSGSSAAEGIQLPIHYNLVVIISAASGLCEVQETIENNCRAITPVTALVLPQVMFDQLLRTEVFVNSILASGDVLYDAGYNTFEDVTELPFVKDIDKESTEALKRANGFLAAAELHLLRNELQLAAFMLHQAIEQFCFGKILMYAGINPKTHNLDKLYRLLRFFSFELVQLFPRDTESEEKLFVLIKEAYIMCRYSSKYKVPPTDAREVRDRLRILLNY